MNKKSCINLQSKRVALKLHPEIKRDMYWRQRTIIRKMSQLRNVEKSVISDQNNFYCPMCGLMMPFAGVLKDQGLWKVKNFRSKIGMNGRSIFELWLFSVRKWWFDKRNLLAVNQKQRVGQHWRKIEQTLECFFIKAVGFNSKFEFTPT